jgi:DUF1365 family protein
MIALMYHVQRFSVVSALKDMYLYYCLTIAPQPFLSEVDVELTFQRDGTPIVEVSFEVS